MAGNRARRTMYNLMEQCKVWTDKDWKILIFDGRLGRIWPIEEFRSEYLANLYDIRKVKDFEYLFNWKLLIVEVE